jgi:hypothetical protein
MACSIQGQRGGGLVVKGAYTKYHSATATDRVAGALTYIGSNYRRADVSEWRVDPRGLRSSYSAGEAAYQAVEQQCCTIWIVGDGAQRVIGDKGRHGGHAGQNVSLVEG